MNDKPRWWWSRTRKAAWHAEQVAQREADRDRLSRRIAEINAVSLRRLREQEMRPRVPALAPVSSPGRPPGTSGVATRSRREDGAGASDPGGWPSWGGSGTSCGPSDSGGSCSSGGDGGGGGGGE